MKVKRNSFVFVLSFLIGLLTAVSPWGNGSAEGATPTPVIVDTDMGFDDWMALLYLLNVPEVDVKAITIDCAGETYCPAGAVNATKLLKLAKKEGIPVFYGEEPAATLSYQFPLLIRTGATEMTVPGFNKVLPSPLYTGNGAAHLENLVYEAAKNEVPVTLISIGSSTNIAQAIIMSRKKGNFQTFKKGIKRIYKGGGAVGQELNGFLTNMDIPGNLTIPGIYASDNKTAEWNIFANASAAAIIVTSGLPVTLVTVNLSDQVPITKASYEILKKTAATNSARFVVADVAINVEVQGGWDKVELDYWDPSVVVAAVRPSFVEKKFLNVPVCIDASGGQSHGTTFVNTVDETSPYRLPSQCEKIGAGTGRITVYTKINKDLFYKDFIKILNRR